MSRRCLAALALCAFVLVPGCAAINPFKLDDTVALFHDDLRWGRYPAAEQAVAASYRARFARRAAAWARSVRIVDMELEAIRRAGLTGTVRARYTWTRPDEIDTRETVIETHWRGDPGTGSWFCDGESVVGGDPALLAAR